MKAGRLVWTTVVDHPEADDRYPAVPPGTGIEGQRYLPTTDQAEA